MSVYYVMYPGSGVQAAVSNVGQTSMPIVALDREKAVVSPPAHQPKIDTSKHFHIFVGDISPELDADGLRAAFASFGEISDCKIIRDPQTLKPKGYGFVTFVNKKDAEQAIASMNGQWLGSRAIRTNWAQRKPPQPVKESQRPSFDEVYSQSSNTNCTVYCGGIMNGLTEELVKEHFSKYGKIMEIRVFKDKGYCFVRYDNKDSATNAIIGANGAEMGGQIVKCSWGKESNDNPGVQSPTPILPLQYGYPISYFYPSAAATGLASQVAVAQSPTAVQPTMLPPGYQYQSLLQGMQGSWQQAAAANQNQTHQLAAAQQLAAAASANNPTAQAAAAGLLGYQVQ